MLRDEIARIVYEGYTGMPWPDEDEHLNNAARKHADEILELPEIKQMRKGINLLNNLMHHIITTHLDMGGKHIYALNFPAYKIVTEIKVWQSETGGRP
jgi:hypothetical protein